MRLTFSEIEAIRKATHQLAGESARVRLFGSRLRDADRGGDIDLMVELAEPITNPALLAARIATRVSRAAHGRKVDVLISAPNLQRQAIHEVAFREGVLL